MAEAGDFHKIGNLRGKDGTGVPIGGTQGDVLQKTGGSDFATAWGRITYADIEGKVPAEDLPQISTEPYVVASESAMLNLPAAPGRMAIRTDVGKTFVLAELPASTLANWVELKTTSDVQSVNNKTGNVVLTKADVGLSKVNNTADSDKPVATASVNGLMPKADKAALNGATYQATANTLVKRTSTGTASFSQLAISDSPSSSGHAATKGYTDDLFGTLAGGSVLSNTNWDAMRSTASTGVVEGWVKGCPAGGAINTTYNMSNGFVKDPVWKLEVRPEGLNYVTQRATLLNCAPKFMVGFAWERIYNPAAAKWSKWTCVAGDTGGIKGQIGGSVTRTDIEAPFRSNENSSVYLYRKSEPLTIHRIAGTIRFFGAMTSTKLDDMASTSTDVAPVLMYMASSSDSPAGNPGGEYSIGGAQNYTFPPQSGSYRNHWVPTTMVNAESFRLLAARYGPNVPSNAPWLPFNITWPAPQVNTYTGSGFLPPAIPPQSSTGNS